MLEFCDGHRDVPSRFPFKEDLVDQQSASGLWLSAPLRCTSATENCLAHGHTLPRKATLCPIEARVYSPVQFSALWDNSHGRTWERSEGGWPSLCPA